MGYGKDMRWLCGLLVLLVIQNDGKRV